MGRGGRGGGGGGGEEPLIEIVNRNVTSQTYKIHDRRNFEFLTTYPTEEATRMLKSYFKFVFV